MSRRYHPDTGHLLPFTPEAARSLGAGGGAYLREEAQVRGTAAATGVAGQHLQYLFGGTAAGFLTGGVALEAGAYGWATEQALPALSRVVVRAYQIARPAVQAYAQRAAKGVLLRMGLDAGFQFAPAT